MAIKILINVVDRETLINEAEAASQPVLGKDGRILPPDENKIMWAASLSQPVIGDEVFPIDQWRHVDEKWVEENAEALAKYPHIMEAHVVLQEQIAKRIVEDGNHHFAKALVDSHRVYGQEPPEIANVVLAIAPVEDEVG